jgi:DNA-binding beta-propeller fold protein YncE
LQLGEIMIRLLRVVSVGIVAATAALAGVAGPASAAPRSDFSGPCCVASDGTNVWVVNTLNNSVTELSAATGSVEQVLSGAQYEFRRPQAITIDAGDVWVASAHDWVTELSEATGAIVRVFGGDNNPYHFLDPVSLTGDGTDLFVLSYGSGTVSGNGTGNAGRVSEIDESTGAMVALIWGSKYQLKDSQSIAWNGTDLFVTDNEAPYRVTEIDAVTGALVRVVRSPKSNFLDEPVAVSVDDGEAWIANEANKVTEMSSAGHVLRLVTRPIFNDPVAIDAVGPDVWVVNQAGSVTELEASTGAFVNIISAGDFSNPSGISSDGSNVWVTNGGDGTVTEINALTDAIVQVIR